MKAKTCWALTIGVPGFDNQSIGLANALGLDVELKRLDVAAPWKYLPPQLWLSPLRFLGPGSDPIYPPWPEVVIGTGRLTIAVSLAIKRASGGHTTNIRIQDPHMAYDEFDIIVAPRHDRCNRPNVIHTMGSLHTITPERLREAGMRFAEKFADLPRPRVAVLVGGTNKCYRLTPEIGRALGEQLAALSATTGGGILLTPSRRTGPEVEAELRKALAHAQAYIWDGTGENPYLAFLALADYIVVTADSVNMLSEACATGKPVYVVDLEGGAKKFQLFHDAMRAAGYTRPFTGVLEEWHYPPLDDIGTVVWDVHRRFPDL
jgi:uncharacterized protein